MSTSTAAAAAKTSKSTGASNSPYQLIVKESAQTLIGAIESQMDRLRQQIQFLQEMAGAGIVEQSATQSAAQPAPHKPREVSGTFAEKAVNFLKSNGPSKASAVIKAFGLAPNSATVRMQQLRAKGIVKQNKSSKLWEVAE